MEPGDLASRRVKIVDASTGTVIDVGIVDKVVCDQSPSEYSHVAFVKSLRLAVGHCYSFAFFPNPGDWRLRPHTSTGLHEPSPIGKHYRLMPA